MRKRLLPKGMLLVLLTGCILTGCQSEKKAVTATKETTTAAQDTTTEEKTNKTYTAGEAVTVQGKNTKLEFTITDYGSFYDDNDNAMIYIKYHAKNLGKSTEVVGPGDFSIYADDYAVNNVVMVDTPYGSSSDNVELASGKMANGVFFAQVDTEEVAKLEVKVEDQKTYVLQHRKASSVQNTQSQKTEDTSSDDSDTDSSYDDDYILPDSDSEYVSLDEVDALSAREKRLAVNEIYARHGRKFDKKEIREYFESKNWYNGTIEPEDFDESELNKYERANIETITDSE